MFAFRCLHPPGGAVALFVALTHASSFRFALFPVLMNSVLLAFAGILYNTGHGPPLPAQPDRGPHEHAAPAAASAPRTSMKS